MRGKRPSALSRWIASLYPFLMMMIYPQGLSLHIPSFLFTVSPFVLVLFYCLCAVSLDRSMPPPPFSHSHHRRCCPLVISFFTIFHGHLSQLANAFKRRRKSTYSLKDLRARPAASSCILACQPRSEAWILRWQQWNIFA